ncbi:MAG TPA: Uma2 family endonuclease [Saprospiraceae bacterium]|nr:Uma2 family endonuclease [Saprospiraceae bacterium]
MDVLQKKLTYREFRELEFDDNDTYWYELINGELVQKQSPSIRHQRISQKIEFELAMYAGQTQSGEMFHAPLDVVLDDNNAYHPDILFIKKDRSFILDNKEQVVIGSPDLVVEILSKSTAVYDKGAKRETYERNGVREYWLVDPRNKSIEVYGLVEQRYRLIAYQEESGIIKSAVLEGFELDIEKIFEE